MPKRRTGRPKLPAEQVRRFMVGFTATAEERRRIKRAAEDDEVGQSPMPVLEIAETLPNAADVIEHLRS